MTDSRSKGSAGERELAAAIHAELGVRLVRCLDQTRDGGFDLDVHADEHGPVADALRRLAVEVKRHRTATPSLKGAWWDQAEAQADAGYRTPVLAYRADRAPWSIVVPLAFIRPDLPRWRGVGWTAELSLRAFCCLIRESIE